MAYAMTKCGSLDNCVTYEFICDTIADMNAIENQYRTIGTVAIVLTGESEGLEVYITGSNKQWNSLSAVGSGSSELDSGLEIYICGQNDISNGLPDIAEPSSTTIYLVPSGNTTGNLYEEYIYVDDTWEKFGAASIDLSNYIQKTDIATQSTAGLVKVLDNGNVTFNENNQLVLTLAGTAVVKTGQSDHPISVTHQHEAAFYGLAKAAGQDMKNSGNAVGTYTTEAANAIRNMIGAGTYSKPNGGIPAADLANGVLDDTTWNGITFDKYGQYANSNLSYVLGRTGTGTAAVTNYKVTRVPTAYNIPQYDADAYLYSVTPSANDNSTKVATTAYVDNAGFLTTHQDISGLAPKAGPEFTGTISLYRKAESTVGGGSVALGYDNIASGEVTYAEGVRTQAIGNFAHAEGYQTLSKGQASHAEGINFTTGTDYGAFGDGDHAEGCETRADSRHGLSLGGYGAHAEGQRTQAINRWTHAEGTGSKASADAAHAEGYYTEALADYSHAEGYKTVAAGTYSHVSGKYNVIDVADTYPEWKANTSYEVGDIVYRQNFNGPIYWSCITANNDAEFTSSKWEKHDINFMHYAEIVGNGKKNALSNARTLDWDGNEHLKGDIYVGCNADSSGGTALGTIVIQLQSQVATLMSEVHSLRTALQALLTENEVVLENGQPLADEQGNIIEYDVPTT